MKTIFVYGTLKKGRLNHYLLGEDKTFIGEDHIRGEMHSIGTVPFVFRGKDLVPGEVWQTNDKNFLRIFIMEIRAGYILGKALTKNLRKRVLVFYYSNEELKNYFPKIAKF